MFRIGLVLVCLALFSCHDKKKSAQGGEEGFSYDQFSGLFRNASLPYQLTDSGFLKNRDTAVIRSDEFAAYIPDSLKNLLFGKGTKVHYVAMEQLPATNNKKFFVVKASGNGKKLALLMAFNKNSFGGVLPILVPDSDPTTNQATSIDKAQSVLKTITQKRPGGVLAEGRDAYEYDADTKQFLLILTNPLNGSAAEVINPIDTLPRKHKFSGDYIKDKKNYVSIRDGRFPNQLQLFMHIGQEGGDCSGELKGDLLMTSATTAIYRQGGDPCIVSLRFTPSSVTVKEDEGCGSRRGLDCSFNGSFTRKKEIKPKSGTHRK